VGKRGGRFDYGWHEYRVHSSIDEVFREAVLRRRRAFTEEQMNEFGLTYNMEVIAPETEVDVSGYLTPDQRACAMKAVRDALRMHHNTQLPAISGACTVVGHGPIIKAARPASPTRRRRRYE